MRTALIFLLLASSAVAQEKTGTTTPSACGPLDVKFEVNRNESKSIEPEPAKALVYVVEDIGRPGSRCLVGCATVRVGLDGAWIGANHGTSHFCSLSSRANIISAQIGNPRWAGFLLLTHSLISPQTPEKSIISEREFGPRTEGFSPSIR